MRRFFAGLLGLALLVPTLASATVLVELHSQEGALSARLIISGDTLLVDDHGQPQLSAADQLLATLTVTAPEEMAVTLPTLSGQSYGDFTLLDQGEPTTRRTATGLEHERQWLIEPYNPGPYQLPELLITGRQGTMTTELILPRPEVKVEEIQASGEDLDDILPPQAPGPAMGLIMALVALALGCVALATWLVIRLNNKRPRALPPKERALAEIARALELPPRAQVERLAFILRCYLASRFNLRCLEQTFDEYSPAITACAEIPPEHRASFLAVLKRCDLIKFSNLEPEANETEALTDQIKTGLAACPLAKPGDKTCGRW